ncbi:sulfate ABC transporter permease subunit [Hamadaea tsunoensis]|uniref:sulfate ABC transporter permease subunit n=1 Tax=Hamadaea tsunoensis TaxID=53368 RepID=UPI000400E56F|nr:sulfate ABC transporter permease subunit [Hamadaea tsunoensis]
MAKWILRLVALAYLLFLLILPIGLIGWRTFADGLAPVIESLTSEEALHAMRVTVEVAIWAVVLNTVFGVGAAILLVRREFPGKRLLNALIDLPLAVSPVVVGLALILAYGKYSTVGGWLETAGIQVIFSVPGMVLATVFVSLPLVVRAIVPVLEQMGDDQEQAARTLGAGGWATFRRITVPGIRGALGYGIVLCLARALGEYGAVAVVSGKIVGETQTLTLFVEERYLNYEVLTAFAAASLLALVAVATLLITRVLRPKEGN